MFKTGDRVKAVVPYEWSGDARYVNGMVGTVIKCRGNEIGVYFDEYDDGHDLEQALNREERRGWWIKGRFLIKLKDNCECMGAVVCEECLNNVKELIDF